MEIEKKERKRYVTANKISPGSYFSFKTGGIGRRVKLSDSISKEIKNSDGIVYYVMESGVFVGDMGSEVLVEPLADSQGTPFPPETVSIGQLEPGTVVEFPETGSLAIVGHFDEDSEKTHLFYFEGKTRYDSVFKYVHVIPHANAKLIL